MSAREGDFNEDDMENASPLKRWLSFLLSLAVTAAFIWGICPALREASAPIKQMADFVDETGIETGAFYYTDVEIVGHADLGARSTIEYPPRGPAPVKE
ncbi:hypothetical protein [Desulfohalovibrio reitneri]|uniref:hypothetical protein n=1 Tax=Desulfohalovibrio reitneri TaxID=1307759 RepID=UPI000A612FA0|nr:hypothetical protein [Desulfohalovibrio reitneri]